MNANCPPDDGLRLTQVAIDRSGDAVALIDRDGKLIYANDGTTRLSGYAREELLHDKSSAALVRLGLSRYSEIWKTAKEEGYHVFESSLHHKTGAAFPVEVAVTLIAFNGEEYAFVSARDITARKSAEALWRSNEERLRLTEYALDHAQDLVSIMDRNGDRLYVNEMFCRFTGHTRESLCATKVWLAAPSLDEASFRKLWDRIRTLGTYTFEIELMTMGGELRPLEINASYLTFSGREVVCTISRDLTARRAGDEEKRRLQQQLQETQKLESLGVLAGGIAHDFNNLLTGVLGNAGLARDRLNENDPLHEPLRQIERAAMRAAELCQQMLAYAGKGRFIVGPVNLSQLVEETAKLLDISVSHRARLELKLAPDLPSVFADSTQLRQIVMNLVLNAAEAILRPDGKIVVTTGRIQINAELVGAVRMAAEIPHGDGVFLEVSDNGSGMDPETLERVFEPFFTTKFTGRGLGLAAVLGIVRSHHGALDVQSELGRGTSFRLFLGAHEATQARDAGTPPPFPFKRRNQGRVLIVDDEESVRSVTCDALQRIGFSVVLAQDGQEAIRILVNDQRSFDAILLDYTMPILDGSETLRAILAMRPKSRVILMSGFPENEARERMRDVPIAAFLQKPFPISLLRKSVEDQLQYQQDAPSE